MGPASRDRRFQSPAHRPTASYCLCLKQHPRRCPCVSLLRALRVIGLLTFAKGPRSPRPHTLTCVSHLGAWQTWSDSGLPGMGPQTTFPTTLGALGPGGQESPEGPLQRWALPRPPAGKRKNGLPTDLRPQTPVSLCWQVGPHPSPQGAAERWGPLRTSFQDSLSLDVSSSSLVALDLKQLLQWKKPIISRHQADYLKKGNLHYV